MDAKKRPVRTTERRSGPSGQAPKPIRLDDLLPATDARGGSRKAIVFGQRNGIRKK